LLKKENGYHICLIAPEGYVHYLAFREVVSLLVYSFISLEIDCTFKVNAVDPQRNNIIVRYHDLHNSELLKKCNYTILQLEQLPFNELYYKRSWGDILSGATEVWDYSVDNIEFLRKEGIIAKHLQIGFHERMKIIKSDKRKDIDVLFYGSINERRKVIIQELISVGLKVEHLFGVYGKERDLYIARSKIVLNCHYYKANLLEVVRLSYLINNKVFLISEKVENNPYPFLENSFFDYDKLVDACCNYVDKENERNQIVEKNFNVFQEGYKMKQFLLKVLN